MNAAPVSRRAAAAGAEAIPSLDGVRAVAVSLVFLAHSGLERVVPGGLGVTIFFVLSGYLITTLMRREHSASGSLDLGAFYLRRWLRLMPPLFLVVSGVALAAALGLVQGAFSGTGLLAVLFYLGNYFVIAHDFHELPAGMGVVWSLAVEEHFYLLFPLLALYLLRHARPARAMALLAALCVLILAWRTALVLQGAPEAYVGMATDTRADAILIGCLLAFGRNPALEPIAPTRPWRDLALALGCVLLLLGTLVIRDDVFRQTLRYSVQGAAIAPLIWLAVVHARRPAARWLNWRPLAYLGTISYTVYLSHQVILDALMWRWPALGYGATLAFGALLTLAVAEPMRRFVERPCARLRRRLHQGAAMRVEPAPPEPTAPTMSISVCIATHKRPQRLAALLGDLAWQRLVPLEVVVVDNDAAGSARAVVEGARPLAPFPIHYAVEARKNIAHARNRTIALARGDWLAFVDDDERAGPNWLSRLSSAAARCGAHGVLGPVEPIVPASAPAWLRRGRLYAFVHLRTGAVVPPNRLRFGNVLLSAPLLRAQQPAFDPAYGLTGGEDGDLLTRLVQAGGRIVWCDEAPVYEPVDPSRLSLRWLLLRALRGGQDFARHALAGRYGPPTAARRAILLARALAQAALALLLAIVCLPLGRHLAAHWLAKASANLGKLSAFLGWHYREYA